MVQTTSASTAMMDNKAMTTGESHALVVLSMIMTIGSAKSVSDSEVVSSLSPFAGELGNVDVVMVVVDSNAAELDVVCSVEDA